VKPLLLAFAAALIASACTAAPNTRAATGECFLLQALGSSRVYTNDRVECAVKSAPASTFKVPHALIALDTGVVTDSLAPMKWDGSDQPFDLWERDHSLDSAVKDSVFWLFQRTAAAVGRERMRAALKKLGYGSDSFEGELTRFWVNGDFVISPAEQLRFLERMMRYELPLRREHVDAVKRAFLMPSGKITNAAGSHDFALTSSPTVLHAKTGNTNVDGERVSWLIGHLEVKGRQYVFVSRKRARGALPGTAGLELARRMLNERLGR
jgi:beta-lactamase class D